MTSKTDEFDKRILAELSTRTLVGGAAIDPAPIATTLGIDDRAMRDGIARLEQLGFVTRSGNRVTITPDGHEELA